MATPSHSGRTIKGTSDHGEDECINPSSMVKSSFEETLIEVWRQALVENADVVELGTERYPVRHTPKRGLRQVDFTFDGNEIRGLEQNPRTNHRGRKWHGWQ